MDQRRARGVGVTTSESPPAETDQGATRSEARTDLDHTRGSALSDPALVTKADRAVRAALREGIIGAEVEDLLDWVATRRAQQRQSRARRRVAEVLAEIHQAEGTG